ncbi:MAG: hypothetical protein HYX92_14020 [Chloroflexi bacterium]|nr:hypothetical protein [Chloroflexota bacterium]
MAELIAGTACGFVLGSISVVVGALMLYRAASLIETLERFLPRAVTPTHVLAALALAVPVILGMAGGFLGLLYYLAKRLLPGAGLGSPNLAFTAAVLVMALAGALAASVLSRRHLQGFLTLAISFAAIFGWLLPYMAG